MNILSLYNDTNNLQSIEEYTKSLSLYVNSFEDVDTALSSVRTIEYNLAVVDSMASNYDAIEFLKRFRHNNRDVPVIFLVDSQDIKLQEKTVKIGAYDILARPVSPILLQAKIEHALRFKKAESLLQDKTLLLEDEVLNTTRTLHDNEHELLDILGKSCEYKEHMGSMHSVRIAQYTQLITKVAGLNEKIQDIAFYAARIYDIGKVALPDRVLLKKDKLNDEEYELVKTHARKGYDLLKYAQGSYLKAAAVISYSHHEKYDGSGYPIGLKGETIPILGRIVSIADVFDALTSKRVYRDAWSLEDACAFLLEEKGKQFDPKFVDLFIENLDVVKDIKKRYK